MDLSIVPDIIWQYAPAVVVLIVVSFALLGALLDCMRRLDD